MKYEVFYNDTEVILGSAMVAADTDLVPSGSILDTPLGQNPFNSGNFARGTMSDPSMPGVVEIVLITSVNYQNENNSLTVVRGAEGTTAVDWPAGAKLECRVTAGMLLNIGLDARYDTSIYGLNIAFADNVKAYRPFGGDSAIAPNSWAVGGNPLMVEKGAMSGSYDANSLMSTTVEAVGHSITVDLGVPPDFEAGVHYFAGSVVRDPEPPNLIYSYGNHVDLEAAEATPPALGDSPWVEVPDRSGVVFKVRLDEDFDDKDLLFYPSEIGFICDDFRASSPPTVSVGEVARNGDIIDLDSMVNAVPMTSITDAFQRIVLATNPRLGVRGMVFSVNTAAVGGTCKGRFYWKGLMAITNSRLGWPTAYNRPDGSVIPDPP